MYPSEARKEPVIWNADADRRGTLLPRPFPHVFINPAHKFFRPIEVVHYVGNRSVIGDCRFWHVRSIHLARRGFGRALFLGRVTGSAERWPVEM